MKIIKKRFEKNGMGVLPWLLIFFVGCASPLLTFFYIQPRLVILLGGKGKSWQVRATPENWDFHSSYVVSLLIFIFIVILLAVLTVRFYSELKIPKWLIAINVVLVVWLMFYFGLVAFICSLTQFGTYTDIITDQIYPADQDDYRPFHDWAADARITRTLFVNICGFMPTCIVFWHWARRYMFSSTKEKLPDFNLLLSDKIVSMAIWNVLLYFFIRFIIMVLTIYVPTQMFGIGFYPGIFQSNSLSIIFIQALKPSTLVRVVVYILFGMV